MTLALSGADITHLDTKALDILEAKAREYLADNPNKANLIIFDEDGEFNVPQVLTLSKLLTDKFNLPVVVLPKKKDNVIHLNGDGSAVASDRYVSFKCKITGDVQQYKSSFELFRAYRYNSPKGDKKYTVLFVNERAPALKNFFHDEFRSISLERYNYLAVSGERKFVLLSERPLRIGHEYQVTGLCFSVKEFQNLKIHLGKKQAVCLATYIVDEEDVTQVDWKVVEKCKGKDMAFFTRSVTYPFDNALVEYAELVTLSSFHLFTGFPLNIILIGGADRSKTAYLGKLSAVYGDEIAETGASTIKGLIM